MLSWRLKECQRNELNEMMTTDCSKHAR